MPSLLHAFSYVLGSTFPSSHVLACPPSKARTFSSSPIFGRSLWLLTCSQVQGGLWELHLSPQSSVSPIWWRSSRFFIILLGLSFCSGMLLHRFTQRKLCCVKVDEANVDTSNYVESSNQWIWVLEAWAGEWLWIKIKEFEIKFAKGIVDLGSKIKDSLLF